MNNHVCSICKCVLLSCVLCFHVCSILKWALFSNVLFFMCTFFLCALFSRVLYLHVCSIYMYAIFLVCSIFMCALFECVLYFQLFSIFQARWCVTSMLITNLLTATVVLGVTVQATSKYYGKVLLRFLMIENRTKL